MPPHNNDGNEEKALDKTLVPWYRIHGDSPTIQWTVLSG